VDVALGAVASSLLDSSAYVDAHTTSLVHSAHDLLDDFKGLLHKDDFAHTAHLEVRGVGRGPQWERGLFLAENRDDDLHSSTAGDATPWPLSRGKAAVTVPKHLQVTEKNVDSERFRGASDENRAVRFAMWLAEKRAELLDHPPANPTETDKYWIRYLNSLPPLEALEKQGVAAVSPESDLRRLEGLPRVGDIGRSVLEWRYVLGEALTQYNTTRGARPKLKYRDALWGLANVVTRAFQCYWPHGEEENRLVGEQIIAPVMDLANHSGENNVEIQCNPDNHSIEFVATRQIQPGEEVTYDYLGGSGNGVQLVSSYGTLEGHQPEHWPAGDCAELRSEHLGDEPGDGPLVKMVGRLVDSNCPAPASAAVTSAADDPVEAAQAAASSSSIADAASAAPTAVASNGVAHTLCDEPSPDHLKALEAEEHEEQGEEVLNHAFGGAKMLAVHPLMAVLMPSDRACIPMNLLRARAPQARKGSIRTVAAKPVPSGSFDFL